MYAHLPLHICMCIHTQIFLKGAVTDYGNFIYFLELIRLSQGQMLKRLFNVLRAIELFMLSNPKSVSELEHEYWLTNLVFSMDLTARLNELNRHPQCETQLNNATFQIITAMPMKQKLWQTRFMEHDCMHVNGENMRPCSLIGYENCRLQDFLEDNVLVDL